jgi:hypothetical protein
MDFTHPSPVGYSGDSTLRPLVVGVFFSRDKVDAAVGELRAAGFHSDQIGVIARGDVNEWSPPATVVDENATSGVATGAASGAIAGAGLGGLWALGIAAGLLPAIGPIVAGGILGSVLASATAGAAAGGLAGGLIGLGFTEEEAQFYESEVTAGRMVVTVRGEGREAEAGAILRAHGAYDVHSAPNETL